MDKDTLEGLGIGYMSAVKIWSKKFPDSNTVWRVPTRKSEDYMSIRNIQRETTKYEPQPKPKTRKPRYKKQPDLIVERAVERVVEEKPKPPAKPSNTRSIKDFLH